MEKCNFNDISASVIARFELWEDWRIDKDGEPVEFISEVDGSENRSEEIVSYYCEVHDKQFKTFEEVKAHVKNVPVHAAKAGR